MSSTRMGSLFNKVPSNFFQLRSAVTATAPLKPPTKKKPKPKVVSHKKPKATG